MILNHIILAVLWIIYCVLHSVLASQRVKNRLKKRMENFKLYRLWYTLFAFIFLAAIVYYEIRLSTVRLLPSNNFLLSSGAIVSLFGLVLMAICIRKYFMNLSGLRSLFIENFSNELQITGIHKYIRHPLYLGTFMFIWGLLLLVPYLSILISNSIITVYTLVGIKLEERKLVAEFGEDYRLYRKTVPKLLPSFKLKREH